MINLMYFQTGMPTPESASAAAYGQQPPGGLPYGSAPPAGAPGGIGFNVSSVSLIDHSLKYFSELFECLISQ